MSDHKTAGQPASKFGARIWAVLGALGILGVVGTGVTTYVIGKGEDVFRDPLKVDVTEIDGSPNFIFPASVKPADAPFEATASGRDKKFVRWAQQSGGIPYGDRSFEVVIRGREAAPVVLGDVKVKVVRKEKLTGGWVNAWEGCGAGLPIRLLEVDLRQTPPKQTLLVDGKPTDRAAFSVSQTEAEVFDLDIAGADGIVSWTIDIRYTSDGKDGHYAVTSDNGEPFKSAGGGAPGVYRNWGESPPRLERDEQAARELAKGGPLC